MFMKHGIDSHESTKTKKKINRQTKQHLETITEEQKNSDWMANQISKGRKKGKEIL